MKILLVNPNTGTSIKAPKNTDIKSIIIITAGLIISPIINIISQYCFYNLLYIQGKFILFH